MVYLGNKSSPVQSDIRILVGKKLWILGHPYQGNYMENLIMNAHENAYKLEFKKL